MADLPEVGSIGDFGWMVVAALIAGLLLWVWSQVKGKAGIIT